MRNIKKGKAMKIGKLVLAAAVAAALPGFGDTQTAEAAKPFRVMSYNIHHGAGMDGVLDLHRIAGVVKKAKPRFVGLQEIDQMTARVDCTNTCALIAKDCGMHYAFARAMTYRGGEYGVAVLSEEAPLSIRQYPLPGREPRVLLLCEFTNCWVGTMHLDLVEERRLESVPIVRRAVAACGDKPVFLTGDWNAHPNSPVLRGLKEFSAVLTPEDRDTMQVDDGKDASGKRKHLCIDYITVDAAHRGGFEVVRSGVVQERVASDHKPMVAEIRARR